MDYIKKLQRDVTRAKMSETKQRQLEESNRQMRMRIQVGGVWRLLMGGANDQNLVSTWDITVVGWGGLHALYMYIACDYLHSSCDHLHSSCDHLHSSCDHLHSSCDPLNRNLN